MIKALATASLILTLCSCDNSLPLEKRMDTTLNLGTPIVSFLKKSSIHFDEDCLKEADVCWYEFSKSANSTDLPNIQLKTQSTSLSIDSVSSVSIFAGPNSKDLVQNANITLRGLPDDSPHESQKKFVYGIIAKLQSSGWRRFIYPYDPRISGQEVLKLHDSETVMGVIVMNHPWFDPDVELSLEQWLSIKSLYEWCFVDDHDNHLRLFVQRSNSTSDPKNKGTYLVTIQIDSEQSFWMKEFEEKDKPNWATLLPKKLDAFEVQRKLIEKKAIKEGIIIDTNYKNPIIRAIE